MEILHILHLVLAVAAAYSMNDGSVCNMRNDM